MNAWVAWAASSAWYQKSSCTSAKSYALSNGDICGMLRTGSLPDSPCGSPATLYVSTCSVPLDGSAAHANSAEAVTNTPANTLSRR